MFNLFEIIPANFFNILTGKNKFIYANILSVIFSKSTLKNSYTFKKEEFIDLIDSYFQDHLFIELDLDDTNLETTHEKSFYIYRKLKECGWIDEEIGVNQEVLTNIEDYAIVLFNTYKDFNKINSFELSSKVYGIYKSIDTFDINQGYLILDTIYNQAIDLMNKLRSLNSNIKKYIKKIINLEKLTEEEELKTILNQLLGEYKEKVIDKAYYYMKTNDNPIKYKRFFKDKLNEVVNDENRRYLIIKQIIEKDEIDETLATSKFTEIVDFLENVFDDVINIMKEIDKKNSKYINVAIQKITIIMNHNKDIEGYLLNILKNYSLINEVDLNFSFSNIKTLNKNSLYTRKTIKQVSSNKIIKEKIEVKEEEFTKLIENSMKFSKKNVQNFINLKLNNKDELTINDFDISIKEEFIKLILTIIYETDSSSNYKIEFLNKNINKNGISLQEFIIRRRDKNE